MLPNKSFFRLKLRVPRPVTVIIICLLLVIFGSYLVKNNLYVRSEDYIKLFHHHNYIVDQYYRNRNAWNLSRLGEVLYQNKQYSEIRKERNNKTFVIWKAHYKSGCPGHFRADCKILSQYLFYLVLENSKCKEYMTEKLFYNAYFKGAIPIIQGPSNEECKQFLPPKSYIHVDDYATIEDLANDVERISNDDEELLSYHKWRNHFEISNEHGHFGVNPLRLCRVCEALNYNDNTESVYSEQKLREFLDPSKLCRN